MSDLTMIYITKCQILQKNIFESLKDYFDWEFENCIVGHFEIDVWHNIDLYIINLKSFKIFSIKSVKVSDLFISDS